jgi:hypothetical protein
VALDSAKRVVAKVNVNVGDGFLPHFSPEFMAHYGQESQFVRALSDLFTLALAQLLERTGQLRDPSDVALYSDEPALESLRVLVARVGDVKQLLLQEAFGEARVGAVASAADISLGPGAFHAWVQLFEARKFEECRHLLQRPS